MACSRICQQPPVGAARVAGQLPGSRSHSRADRDLQQFLRRARHARHRLHLRRRQRDHRNAALTGHGRRRRDSAHWRHLAMAPLPSLSASAAAIASMNRQPCRACKLNACYRLGRHRGSTGGVEMGGHPPHRDGCSRFAFSAAAFCNRMLRSFAACLLACSRKSGSFSRCPPAKVTWTSGLASEFRRSSRITFSALPM